jgi:tRNA (cmo5U34)-methyltransferase
MSNPLNRFNWLAKHYDFLAGIIFGKTLQQSQLYFLRSIPPGCSILIMGGGTGEVLRSLLDINPTCRVWYVEASGEMVSIASKKIRKNDRDRVSFIHGTEDSIPDKAFFDVIITSFFLDLYSDEGVLNICKRFYHKLNKDGLWFVSDFVDGGKRWHRVMLWTMYRFFVLTCTIEGSKLPSWQKALESTGLAEMEFKFFYGGFIKSAVYKKVDEF